MQTNASFRNLHNHKMSNQILSAAVVSDAVCTVYWETADAHREREGQNITKNIIWGICW